MPKDNRIKQAEARKRAQYAGSAHFYEAERYRESPHMAFYLNYRAARMAEAISAVLPNPEVLVDVGCGTGVNLGALSRAFPRAHVAGLDLSRHMLQQAMRRPERSELSFSLVQASAFHLPLADASVDAVISTRFIHQFSHSMKVSLFAELRRVVRPGGCIVVEFYARPYARLQYHLPAFLTRWRKAGGPQEAPLHDYLQHYPSRGEVQEIVAGPCRRVPVRASFCRVLHKVLGPRGLESWTRLTRLDPLAISYSEYLVVLIR